MQAKASQAYDTTVTFDTDSGTIGVDNRCSGCTSHIFDDFTGPVQKTSRAIKGFGGTKTINVWIGTLLWRWQDDEGVVHKFRIPNSYYVPDGHVRLLSPQHWAKTQRDYKPTQGTGEATYSNSCELFWNQRKNRLTIPLGKKDNVATFRLAPGFNKFTAFCAECGADPATETDDPVILDDMDEDDIDAEVTCMQAKNNHTFCNHTKCACKEVSPVAMASEGDNDNSPVWCTPIGAKFELNGASEGGKSSIQYEKEDERSQNLSAELLRHHQQFGHVSFQRLRLMARAGIIPKRLVNAPIPACSACLYAKAMRRRWRSRTAKNYEDIERPTKAGHCVSVDQMISPTPGLIAQMTGKLTTKRYTCATVFIDQATRLSYVYIQKSTNVVETLEAKAAFEECAKARGVTIRAYHADNGVFKANAWIEKCKQQGQRLTFAGVNAHHQNGMAERRIRLLTELTRTMLIHSNKKWPTVITTNLWPYALRMANNVLNETPSLQDQQRRTPQQIFSNTRAHTNPKHWKPFGCPVCILEDNLQQQKPFHKWKERAKVGVYLGKSPQHSRNVDLVLDRHTGLVSPQFHLSFDPMFETVTEDIFDSLWQRKAGFVATLEQSKKLQSKKDKKKAAASERDKSARQQKGTKRSRPEKSNKKSINNKNDVHREQQAQKTNKRGRPNGPVTNDQERGPTRTKSGREVRPVDRLMVAMAAEVNDPNVQDIPGELLCLSAIYPHVQLHEQGKKIDLDVDPLLAHKATADPDAMHMHQAMKQPDKNEFIKAMKKEWKDQFENGNFSLVHKSELPKGATVLPAVWQMKRKRCIRTRDIKKWKARLNIDGSRMRAGIHYDQTYSPVASWNSIRTLLILSAVNNWHTRQLDFVLAFTQAPVERDIYMKIPKGFEIEDGSTNDYVLQLHRNVYGQKQAGRVWNQHLTKILTTKLGFQQSEVDECVFYKGRTMYVLYTDDSILAGPDEKEIDQIIKDMKKAKLDITVEGDIQDFLGVNIDRRQDGTINLTQPHLITQILKDLRLDKDEPLEKNASKKFNSIPAASSRILKRHSDSTDFDNSFNYRSVIGKLNYLEKGSRSDIAYITHQCARFSTCAKKEHAEAIRWLGRYLKGTRDKGTILKPDKSKGLEVHVDADFAGNWDPKGTGDPGTARSRHGYIIMYAGCPILWKSALQTEIALSSCESEYTGLSYALRDAIPIMEMLKEMIKHGFDIQSAQATVHCKVFEDNSGALEIARVHKYRPRTKHLNVKLHHFRSYVDRQEVSIHKAHTDDQRADYLTKPVNEDILARHRKVVMGW